VFVEQSRNVGKEKYGNLFNFMIEKRRVSLIWSPLKYTRIFTYYSMKSCKQKQTNIVQKTTKHTNYYTKSDQNTQISAQNHKQKHTNKNTF
jgi:hypothetical protein